MLNNDKVLRCACDVRGQCHSFTADTSGKHVLLTDPERSTLLQDTTWFVAPIQRGNPSKLHARAASRAPGIKKGRLLHRLALKMRYKKRKVRAISGNLLDVRSSNLQTCTASDIRILNRAAPVTRLVGVHHAVPPKWLKTDCVYHSSISVAGNKLHLGSFRTLVRKASRDGCDVLVTLALNLPIPSQHLGFSDRRRAFEFGHSPCPILRGATLL